MQQCERQVGDREKGVESIPFIKEREDTDRIDVSNGKNKKGETSLKDFSNKIITF